MSFAKGLKFKGRNRNRNRGKNYESRNRNLGKMALFHNTAHSASKSAAVAYSMEGP
jgi:hypothetical protein